MEDHDANVDPVRAEKCRDSKLFDRFLLIYFLGIVVVSFYVLFSFD
ncbi:MAG: hypothetical protein SA339_13945 [Methanomassiliicoccus sp.]|nr:hypothetical protein [Methanomassiliicoccus sp.]